MSPLNIGNEISVSDEEFIFDDDESTGAINPDMSQMKNPDGTNAENPS